MFVGVDIGGMSVKCGIVDRNGNILFKKTAPIKRDAEDETILQGIAALIADTVKDGGFSAADIEGIGLGCPGSIYDEKGIVRYCCNINFRNTPMAKRISELCGVENVKVSNDANCAALGETLFGAGKGAKNSVLVTLGTGVGTGIIVNGKLLTGNQSAGAEGGHITISAGGELCGCGKRGHYEAYASATALMNQTEKACKENPSSLLASYVKENGLSGKAAFICAKQGDGTAKRVVEKYIEYVGEGLVVFANIFYPEVIIIGGGISNEGENFLAPIKKYVAKNVYGAEYAPEIKVVLATLKNDAGIVGAAALVMD